MKAEREERRGLVIDEEGKTKVKPSLLDTHEMVVLHVTHSDSQAGRAAARQRGLLLSAAPHQKNKIK